MEAALEELISGTALCLRPGCGGMGIRTILSKQIALKFPRDHYGIRNGDRN